MGSVKLGIINITDDPIWLWRMFLESELCIGIYPGIGVGVGVGVVQGVVQGVAQGVVQGVVQGAPAFHAAAVVRALWRTRSWCVYRPRFRRCNSLSKSMRPATINTRY